MADDWSLKGKRINKPDCEICSRNNIYSEETLETLRKKLIEDINKNTEWALSTRIEMIKQINKRFGVEKEA